MHGFLFSVYGLCKGIIFYEMIIMLMNLISIYQRTRDLIIKVPPAWDDIIDEAKTRNKVLKDYLIPVSVMIGLASLVGTLLFSNIEDSFSISYVIFNGVISFMIIFLEVYLSGWLIMEVASSFSEKSGSDRIFNLVIYSHAPFFLVLLITKLFPQLLILMILGIYSFYVLWIGIRKIMHIQEDRKIIFLILSSLVMIMLYLLLSVIFNSIYDVVIGQFNTFGS